MLIEEGEEIGGTGRFKSEILFDSGGGVETVWKKGVWIVGGVVVEASGLFVMGMKVEGGG